MSARTCNLPQMIWQGLLQLVDSFFTAIPIAVGYEFLMASIRCPNFERISVTESCKYFCTLFFCSRFYFGMQSRFQQANFCFFYFYHKKLVYEKIWYQYNRWIHNIFWENKKVASFSRNKLWKSLDGLSVEGVHLTLLKFDGWYLGTTALSFFIFKNIIF